MDKLTRHKNGRKAGKAPAGVNAPLAELVRYLARRAAERDYAAIQSAQNPDHRPHGKRGTIE